MCYVCYPWSLPDRVTTPRAACTIRPTEDLPSPCRPPGRALGAHVSGPDTSQRTEPPSSVVWGRRGWPPTVRPTQEGGHAVSSHVVLRERGRSRPLILAAASVAAVASLALAGPMLAQSEEPEGEGEVYTVNAATTDLGTFLTGEDGKTLY